MASACAVSIAEAVLLFRKAGLSASGLMYGPLCAAERRSGATRFSYACNKKV